MGRDWHPYVEHLVDGSWEPKWKPVPHPSWWYEDLLEEKIQTDAARILFPKADPKEYPKLLVAYYEGLPWSDVLKEFGDRPGIKMLWREHAKDTYWKTIVAGKPNNQMFWNSKNYKETLKSRNYYWFELFDISGYNPPLLRTHSGLPEKLSPELTREYSENWEADAHTIGWIMVDDLLDQYKKLPSEYKRGNQNKHKWLQTHAQGCRLTFWFDN